MSDEPEWDFWDEAGLHCSGYDSEQDRVLVAVFIETGKGASWYADIAKRLGLPECYVKLLMEILSSAGFCEYGTSPRGAWAVHDSYEANVQKLRAWYERQWGEPFSVDKGEQG